MEEANKLIGTGQKHLVMGKVVEAVSALQEACGMLAKEFGDTADECGEAFFWCGKALLELARMENSVLGNALEGVPEEEEAEDKPKDSNVEGTENIDEKTRDELRVQVYDAMAEKKDEEAGKAEAGEEKAKQEEGEEDEKSEAAENKSGEAENKSGESENKEEKDTKKEGADKEPSATTKKESADNDKENVAPRDEEPSDKEKDSTSKEEPADKEDTAEKSEEAEGGEEEEDAEDVEMGSEAEQQGEGDATAEKDEEEEVGNLQLAWEMLEVAKVIYKRRDTKEDQLMAAQVHLKLGEVSSESGNHGRALEDFQECLKLQTARLEADSRLLAETHYQLGVTYNLDCQYGPAIEALNSSMAVIKSRLDKLKEMIDKAEGPEALPEERKEMEELTALLPEIQEKVEDATESQKCSVESVKSMLDGGSTSACPASSDGDSSAQVKDASPKKSTSAAPVSDISHLVRKKRKPEESPVKESPIKKVKQDGDHEANGSTKGDTKEMEVEKV